MFKHANCVGCLKAGKLHWYIVYCTRPDVWKKAKWSEDEIGYTIIKDTSLFELEGDFEKLKQAGVTASEHEDPRTFWARARRVLKHFVPDEGDLKPCECTF